MTILGQQQPPPPLGQQPPPPGPGVYPPFPAPPVEGRGRRLGLGLGLGAGVLLLVCGGGAAAAVGLVTVMGSALNEQADVVVSHYLDALRDREWSKAYDMLCEQAKQRENEAQFTSRVAAAEPIASWDVGTVDLVRLAAPVAVTYADGDTADLHAYFGQSRETGGFEVCGVEE